MKTSLAHLPYGKREDILQIKDLILEYGKSVEMVILFGSYARGDWVEDYQVEEDHSTSYISDCDILVVTGSRKAANDLKAWHDVRRIWNWDPKSLRVRVSIIAHDIRYLNQKLEIKHYFFTQIKREGVMLYDSGNFKLARRRKLDMPEIRKIAKENFSVWFENAKMFYKSHEANFQLGIKKKSYLKIAAFELHQAAENAYHALSLVFTSEKPKCHDLRTLGDNAASHSVEFRAIFPEDMPKRKHLFDLLVRAYVEARYSKHYKITKSELEYLAKRVEKLLKLVETLCKGKLRQMASE